MSEVKVLKPPGELIVIDDRQVHFQRSGEGSPLVVFESGIFSESMAFFPVQSEISKDTCTLSYDRAGHGYSDPSPNTKRIWSVIVDEFCELLDTLDIWEPMILVGWSAGAQYIRNFADKYPERVAGLVFLDSPIDDGLASFPDELSQIIKEDDERFRLDFLSKSKMSIEELLDEFGENPPWSGRHPDTHSYYQNLASPEQFKYFLDLLSFWKEEEKKGERRISTLGDIPLTVIYAIEKESQLFSEDQLQKSNRIWAEKQAELATLSTSHQLIEVVCGHDIANEKPEVVIAAVLEMIELVRSG
jgi:pimeloyl-ACP methyl ester carboxylesterase